MIKIEIKQTGDKLLKVADELDLAIMNVLKKHNIKVNKDSGVNMYGRYNRIDIYD